MKKHNVIFKSRAAILTIAIGIVFLVSNTPHTHAQRRLKLEPTYPDVRYVEDGDYKQKVDIYLPDNAETALPTILLLHGNGYTKWDMEPLANYFVQTRSGYAAVAVEYRDPFPEFQADVLCAVAWAHAEGEAYGIDSSQLFILGHSKGGGGAAMAGVINEPTVLLSESNCPHELPEDDWLQGVMLFAAGGIDPTNPRLDSESQAFIETLLTEQIDGSEPPFLILQGTDDVYVPASSATNFAAALETAGVEHTLVILEGMGHFFTDPESENGQVVMPYVDEFLKQVLANQNINAEADNED